MTTQMKTKKSRLHDQAKLKIICDELCDNIDTLLSALNIEYRQSGKMIVMSCPIHGGDNEAALNLYPEGETYRGNWKCRSHHCENIFKGSIIGFVRGVLSRSKHNWSKDGDKTCSFEETVEFCLSVLNKDISSIKISNNDKNKKNFISIVSNIVQKTEHSSTNKCNKMTRNHVINNLKIPCKYFISRGFSKEILEKYDVGLCDNKTKEMFNRAVVPIYDNDYNFVVGCTGRSIFEICEKCKSYHNPTQSCPSAENKWKYSKWKHNIDFKSQNYLYNFWFAKEFIKKTGVAVIVESPGNVWRLEESGIHNSVAIFGSSLSDRQKFCLDSSGAMTLVVLTDNDDAGRYAAEKITEKCKNTYRIYIPKISKPDIAEMTVQEINQTIKKEIENLYD